MITIEASELDTRAVPGVDLQLRGLGHEVAVEPQLTIGDYFWVSGAGLEFLERKKFPGDLISSFKDGRLQRFVEGDMPNSRKFLLLQEPRSAGGIQTGLGYANWTWERLDNLLVSIQSHGIIIVRSVDTICGVAERINHVYNWTQKAEHTSLHRATPAIPAKSYPDPLYRHQVAALMCTRGEQRGEGIDEELARRALTAAGGRPLKAIALVIAGKIKGVGTARAQAARKFWKGQTQ